MTDWAKAPQTWRTHQAVCGKCRTGGPLADLCAQGLALRADLEAARPPRPRPAAVTEIDGQLPLFGETVNRVEYTAAGKCECPRRNGMTYHDQDTCTDPVAARLGWYARPGESK